MQKTETNWRGFYLIVALILGLGFLVVNGLPGWAAAAGPEAGASQQITSPTGQPGELTAQAIVTTAYQEPASISFTSANNLAEQVVPLDVTWNLQFDQDLKIDTATADNIFVQDAAGNRLEAIVSRLDYRHVLVAPPAAGYLPGRAYTLVIGNGLQTDSGAALTKEANQPFLTPLGQWAAGSSQFQLGQLQGDYRLLDAQGPSGLTFYTTLQGLALTQEQNYQLTIRAARAKNINLLTSTAANDPVLFKLTVYEDRNSPVVKDLEVRASDLGEDFQDLNFLFTRPAGQAGQTLVVSINYQNYAAVGNVYDLQLGSVSLQPLPLNQVNAELLGASRILNSAVLSAGNVLAPQIQVNPNLMLQRLASGNFSVAIASAASQEQDTDGDGIRDDQERNGFVYTSQGMAPWNGDEKIKYYKTDPSQWSTDGDPYGDRDELTGAGMDSSVRIPGNNPLVAAFPIIGMEMTRYTIVPVQEITLSSNRSFSREFSESTSTSYGLSASVTVGVEVGVEAEIGVTAGVTGSVKASMSATVGAEYGVSREASTSNGSTQEWGQATASSSDHVADLRLHLKMKNTGTATARDITPIFSVYIGNKPVTSIQLNLIPVLRPNSETDEFTVTDSTQGNTIPLSLDDVKAIQMGVPLRVKLLTDQTEAKVSRWNSDSNTWEQDASWIDAQSQIDSRSVTLRLNTGDGLKEYRIFAGTPYFDPQLTLRQALMHVADVQERVDGIYINGAKLDLDWIFNFANVPPNYFTDNPPRDNKILNLILKPGMQVYLAARNTGPQVKWAQFDSGTRRATALVAPSVFPLRSVMVKGVFNGIQSAINLALSPNNITYTAILPENFVPFQVEATDVDSKTATFSIDVVEELLNDVVRPFTQGEGYQAGAYDLQAAQPTTTNWSRQSRFTGTISPGTKWEHFFSDQAATPPVIGADGTIYILHSYATMANPDRVPILSALSPDNQLLWDFQLGSMTGETGSATPGIPPVIGQDGTIYVTANYEDAEGLIEKGKLHAINKYGFQKWEFATDALWNSAPAIGSDGTIYLGAFNVGAETDDGKLYAIAADGRLKWSVSTGTYAGDNVDFGPKEPVIGTDGTIYIIGKDTNYEFKDPDSGAYPLPSRAKLVAFDPADGSKKWEFFDKIGYIRLDKWQVSQMYSGWGSSEPVIGNDGTVYLRGSTSDGPKLMAILSDGSQRWEFQPDAGETGIGVPAVARDGTVYIPTASADGAFLYALEPVWGQKIWKYTTTGASWIPSPPVIGMDGTVYLGVSAGSWSSATPVLEAVNADSTRKWTYSIKTGAGKLNTQPVIGPDGAIYVLAGDSLFAIKATGAGRLRFLQSGHNIAENGGNAQITVFREAGSEGTVTVAYNTGGGTAVAGTDYQATSGTLTFAPGEQSKKFSVPIMDNSAYSGNRTVALTLSSPTGGATLGSPAGATLTILEDDPATADGSLFRQGAGYQPGAYDLNAGTPTATNWTRQSRFTGSTTNQQKWAVDQGSGIYTSPVVGAGGTVYVGFWDNKVRAVNPDGSTRWEFATGGPVKSPAIGNGVLYVASEDHKLYALDLETGSMIWEFAAGGAIATYPAIGSDGTVYVGARDNKLYAVNPNGSEKWNSSVNGSFSGSPSIGNDGTIYQGIGSKLQAFTAGGQPKWQAAVGGNLGTPVIGDDGTIYAGSNDGYLYAFAPDGSTRWRRSIGAELRATIQDFTVASPAISANGAIYIGSDTGILYSFDASGNPQATFTTGDRIQSAPIIGADGTVYIGSWDGKLYALNPDGSKKWEATAGSRVFTPALGSDGTIYFGSHDSKLYAIGVNTPVTNNLQLRFTQDLYTVGEEEGSVSLTVNRVNGSTGVAGVAYSVTSTATAGQDYNLGAGSLVFASGEASKTITIPILNDSLYEGNETLVISLSNPTGGAELGTPATTTVVIIDDDPAWPGVPLFRQGSGYQPGAYDLSAAQPAAFNWTRQSRFTGSQAPVRKWAAYTDGIYTAPVVGNDGTVYAGLYIKSLRAINPDGSTKWDFATGGIIQASPAIGADGTIYIGSSDHKLYAVKPDGSSRWVDASGQRQGFDAGDTPLNPAIGADGTIYFGAGRTLFAVNPDGTEQWRFTAPLDNNFSSAPAIGRDGAIYIANWNGKLYAVTAGGQLKWELVVSNGQSAPAIDNNGNIYLGSWDGYLRAVNPDGALLWQRSIGAESISTPAISAGGSIYIGSGDNNLYAFTADGNPLWQYATGGGIRTAPVIGADGTVYVGSDDSKLYAINPNGTKKWDYNLGGANRSSPAIGADGTIYIGANNGYLHAINGQPGTLHFELSGYTLNENGEQAAITVTRSGGSHGEVSVSFTTAGGGTAIAGTDYTATTATVTFADGDTSPKTVAVPVIDNSVYAGNKTVRLELKTPTGGAALGSRSTAVLTIMEDDGVPAGGQLFQQGGGYQPGAYDLKAAQPAAFNWTRQSTGDGSPLNTMIWDYTTGGAVESSPVTDQNGNVYFGSRDNKVYALDAQGNKKWEYATAGPVTSSPAIGLDGTVYVGSRDQKLYALDANSGKRWEFTTGGMILASPAIGADGTLYIGSMDNKVYALDGQGAKQWEFTAGAPIVASPVLGIDGTIYIGSRDQKLYALNPDGTKQWEFRTGGSIEAAADIGQDNTIYVGTLDGKLYALNPDASLRWTFATGDWITAAPAIGKNGTIYIGSFDKQLYALNPDGSKQWDFTTGGAVQSTPVIGNTGIIYVGSDDGKLYAINPDGNKRWELATGGPVKSAPAVAGGRVYAGSGDGKLYALEGAVIELATGAITVSEGGSSVNIEVRRTGHRDQVTVDYVTQDGTARAGQDYEAISGTLTFAVGEASKNLVIPLIFDTVAEGDETLKLSLSNPAGNAALGPVSSVQITVKNSQVFQQGQGYQAGQYDSHAAQPATFNWTRQSAFAGPRDPVLQWAFTTGGSIGGDPVIGAGGTIYIDSNDNNLYAINPDGSEQWRFAAVGSITSDPVIAAGGTILFGATDNVGGGGNNQFYALNPDGSLQWNYIMPSYMNGSPAIAQDGALYLPMAENGQVIALNPDGTLRWTFTTGTGGRFDASPAIGSDGTIYLGSTTDQNLYAIDSDGTQRWQYLTGGGILSSAAIGADGTVYVGSGYPENKVYAFNPDGSVLWTVTMDGAMTATPAIGSDGTIYIGSNDGYFYALNPDGTEKWKAVQGITFFNILPPLVGADGIVYITAKGDDGSSLYLRALNPDGTLLWQVQNSIPYSSAIGLDGTIYFGSSDGKLYAYGDEVIQASTVQFSAAEYSIAENGGSTDITVTRTGDLNSEVIIEYSTADGTAAAGVDYTATSGTLTFAGTDTTKTFSIPILDDGIYEGDEILTINLSSPTSGAILGSPRTATLTITDDELPPPVGPSWPAGATLTASSIGQLSLVLNWSHYAGPAIASYGIFQDRELLATVSPSISTNEVRGLAPGTGYTFQVEVQDTSGAWSSDGPSVTASTLPGSGMVVTLANVPGGKGHDVLVPVTVTSAAGMSGFQISISYDPELITGLTVTKGSLLAGDANWSLSASPAAAPGKVTVIGYNSNSEGLTTVQGELLKLTATLAASAAEGTQALLQFTDLANSAAVDSDGNQMEVHQVDGAITIYRTRGDVNNDGSINILDVVRTVNIALGKLASSDAERFAADANGDGNINVLDVVRIVNWALGKE